MIYSCRNLTELIIPDNYGYVNCTMNNLTELLLHDDLLRLFCWDNNINKLNLNNNLIDLSCDIFVDVININNEKLKIRFW